MKVKLSKKEIRLINEACEFFMRELKEYSSFDNSALDEKFNI